MARAEELKKEASKRYGTHLDREMAFLSGGAYADSHPLNPWKSVKEELPKENLFLRDRWGDVFMAEYYYCNCDWWDVRGDSCREDEIRDQYVHFMPIPELPKEDTK